MIRIVKHPELYVGKSHVSYAIRCDQDLQDEMNRTDNYGPKRYGWKTKTECLINPHGDGPIWFTKEKMAKVWTTAVSVKKILSYCHYDKVVPGTFDEFEIVKVEDGVTTFIPATEFYNNWKNY